jgi:hypothetical protein
MNDAQSIRASAHIPKIVMNKLLRSSLLAAVLCSAAAYAPADEVTDWNQIMLESLPKAGVGGVLATRPAATVQAAVFDALNGIEQRYGWIHVQPAAPAGASRRAAVVQAAYASLVQLFPAQQPDLAVKRTASLAAIASSDAAENSESIARGIQWGQLVANAIVAWRAADGFLPAPAPYTGGIGVGQWRPTLPAFASFSSVQLRSTTLWVLPSPSQVPLPGPPALTSAKYAADFNEVKAVGSLNSATRTADQTQIARFWASTSSPNYFANRLAVALGAQRNTTLSENARILALINVAIADAGISIWQGKYSHLFWRPITAIQLADTDNNPATSPDGAWLPFLATPPYPDYPSGLCGLSAAGFSIVAAFFGENTNFVLTADSGTMAGVTRSYSNFSAAAAEAVNARIYSGLHFRFADQDAADFGNKIGQYILSNACLPLHGKKTGQLR